MVQHDIYRQAILTAQDFHRRKLWERFTNYDCIGIHFTDLGESYLAAIMGNAGEEFGLMLMRGPAAVDLLRPSAFVAVGDDSYSELDMLSFNMEPFGNFVAKDKRIIRQAGFNPKSDEWMPSFLAKRPYHLGCLPDACEIRILIQALRALMKADDRRELVATELDDPEGICTLTLMGNTDTLEVTVTRQHWQMPERQHSIQLPGKLPNLKGLPRLPETWLVGLSRTPGKIKSDDREMRLLLVVEEASGLAILAFPCLGEGVQESRDQLVHLFRKGGIRGIKGVPRLILFSSHSLFDAMRPILASVGVPCRYELDLPKLQEAVDSFNEFFAGEKPDANSYPDEEDIWMDRPIPAPDDLKGWKQIDYQVVQRWNQLAQTDRFWSSRALFLYYDEEEPEVYLEKEMLEAADHAFIPWRILAYRGTRKSRTLAEKVLQNGLPQAQAILIRAQMEAHPSLYRVIDHNTKRGTVRLEDILLGGGITVHDQLMSEQIRDGEVVAVRIYPAGNFHFIQSAGPLLGPDLVLRAVNFLQDQGIEFTPDGLKRDSHVFGWLWTWAVEENANFRRMKLTNMDGDSILWHTASFSIQDSASVRRALEEREDIEYDEMDDEYSWVTHSGKAVETMQGPVNLGRIEFVGNELILTVNSQKRFETGRKWLEKIPGVSFIAVKTRKLNDPDIPADERVPQPDPGPMPPEVKAEVMRQMKRHYMSWLDTPIPALGNMTPRQRCQTEQGRQEVARQIRSMPEPIGPEPIQVPRKEMLRELGMHKEADAIEIRDIPASDPYSDRLEPIHSSAKVGRNEPCPCGSGKKYKKCCGRDRL